MKMGDKRRKEANFMRLDDFMCDLMVNILCDLRLLCDLNKRWDSGGVERYL